MLKAGVLRPGPDEFLLEDAYDLVSFAVVLGETVRPSRWVARDVAAQQDAELASIL